MVAVVQVLVTETGEYKMTDGLAAIWKACRVRRDGQPDARTRAGQLWYREFKKFSDQKMQEFLAA